MGPTSPSVTDVVQTFNWLFGSHDHLRTLFSIKVIEHTSSGFRILIITTGLNDDLEM